jgi:signal peptidase II
VKNVTIDRKKPLVILVVLFVLALGADQGCKQWAQHTLLDSGFAAQQADYPVCRGPADDMRRERFIQRHRVSITVVEGYFDLKYVENCASAFGLMSRVPERLRFPFFMAISVLAMLFIPYLYRKTPSQQRFMLYALPFVLAGAVGNLLDRLIYRYVIDFVEWYVVFGGEPRHWPTFNVADAAIVVGIGLMILEMIPWRRKKDSQDSIG